MTKHLRSFLFAVPLLSAVFGSEGCSCDPALGGPSVCATGTLLCESTMACVAPDGLCSQDVTGGAGWSCPDLSVVVVVENGQSCSFECGAGNSACQPPPKLEPGQMWYQDSAFTDAGAGPTFALSAYSIGWYSSFVILYGDLVYGEWDPATDTVDWEIVDGVPAGAEPIFDPTGWRDGIGDPGNDVGRYSSIATIGDDVYITYEDTTNKSLKIATRIGGTWSKHVIDDTSGGALYTSVVIHEGNPVVVYGTRATAAAPGAQPTGEVRVARASTATPSSTGDWTIETLPGSSTEIGCVAGDGLCATGDRCVTVGTTGLGECVTPTQDCATTCGSSTAAGVCANTECRLIKKGSDLIDATGLFSEIMSTPDGSELAVVYHDRMSGNLFGQQTTAGAWGARFLVDGWGRVPGMGQTKTWGDCGQSATFTIDALNVWHVAYVDGTWDRLRYSRFSVANAANGTIAGQTFSVVDDGTPCMTCPATRTQGFRRIIGDDASLVLAGTEVRILYGDVSAHVPVFATRDTAAAANDPWTIVELPSTADTVSGAWTTQALDENGVGYCAWMERSQANDDSIDMSTTNVDLCPAIALP